jgi:hypothetical protein
MAWAEDKRLAWVALGCAMAVAAAIVLWLGRGMTFWGDELAVLMASPHLTLSEALRPHDGHLALTARVVYKVFFEAFGTAYLPFRLLTVGATLSTVALLFAYASRRVGPWVALAPSVVLLAFGSDSLHVLVGNGFAVLLSITCGLGALLALERSDRRGDAVACALLCLGAATYTVALAFVVGAAIAIVLGEDRRRRIWVVGVPVALYAAWWLWTLHLGGGSESQVSLLNILVTPAWGFQTLSEVLGALSGLDYPFSGPTNPPLSQAGPTLALLAFVGFGLRLWWRPVPAALWASAGVILALWLMGALTADPSGRSPSDARYLYSGAVVALLVGANAVAGLRWSKGAVVAIYVTAAAGLGANLTLLQDTATDLRGIYAVQTRAAFTGLDLAGRRTAADFVPPAPIGIELPLLGPQSPLGFPFGALAAGKSASQAYLDAAERYGPLGFSVQQLREQAEPARAQADSVLIAALGLKLMPASGAVAGADCKRTRPGFAQGYEARLPRGGALLRAEAPGTEVQVRRFASTTAFGVGTLKPGQAAVLRIPSDRVAAPWWVYAPGSSLTVCALR